MQQPFAVAAPTPELLLVAGTDGVQGVDTPQDAVLFTVPRAGSFPNDAFAFFDDSRSDWVAGVAWSNFGTSSQLRGAIRELTLFTLEGSTRRMWTGTQLGLGNATAIAPAPPSPSRLLAMDPARFAAAELTPNAQAIETSPPLVPMFTDTTITSIGTARTSTNASLVAWTVNGPSSQGVLVVADPYTAATPSPSIYSCTSHTCEYLQVIGDPTRERAAIALCAMDGVRREILRLDFVLGGCETLVPADRLTGTQRFSYLSIAASR
jgi:hypothetical protein